METIYYGGSILTMADRNAEAAIANAPEAIIVRNGVIAAAGNYEALSRTLGPRARRVDLQGRCLMPGFIDAHGHCALMGQMAMLCDLSACRSFAEVIAMLKGYIREKKLTRRHAVMGFGYDHNFLEEQAHPDKRVLDQVSREIPIFILHVSAHLACANSAALALSGITAETEDPSGGVIGRLEGSREPSGYLEEAGIHLIRRSVMTRIRFDLPAMLHGVQQQYLAHGVTTIQDGATTGRDILLLKVMSALGMLKLDVVAYPLLTEGGAEILRRNKARDGRYRRHLKLGGCKLVLDGSPQGRSAWLSEPYLGGEAGFCGYPWLQDDEVQAHVRRAVEDKRQLLAHCNGDAASEQFLNAYEKALTETGCRDDLRPVMIHCQTVRRDQLDRMARLGMIASVFVGHVWYWGDVHLRNLGDARGHRISPVREALERGVRVTFHQDPPVTRPDMLHSVWCAVNRLSRGGQVIGAEQAVSVYDALRAVTAEAAYQYSEESTKGTLSPGKRADMVILSASPLEAEPMAIRDIRVLETIKDGRTVHTA